MSNIYIYINNDSVPSYWNENWNRAGAIILTNSELRQMATDDFKGFYFNGHHSSEFHILRTSNSNRYTENLTPTLNDKTVDVPNGDGKYYFSTYYKEKTFQVNYAFDDLSELDLQNLKKWLNGKELGALMFDEEPYKIYTAKVTGTSQIKYICFNKTANERVYKGEGTINFTCYYPFARTADSIIQITTDGFSTPVDGKLLSAYQTELFPSKVEWQDASRLEEAYIVDNSFLNLGDIPTNFVMSYATDNVVSGNIIKLKYLDAVIGTIKLKTDITKPSGSSNNRIVWDSKTGIVKYCYTNSGGNERSQLLRYTGNGICQLPVTNNDVGAKWYFQSSQSESESLILPTMEYNYLYY